MSFIPFLEGKKVYTPDGIFVGIIKKVYISEFGTHTAVIQTNFKELPEFEVIVTSLRHTKITRGGKTEEAYILKEVPIKIRIIIDELKQKYAPAQQVPRKIEQRKVPLPTATQTQTTPPTQPATREIAKELLERRRTTTESKPEISALPTYKKIIQTPKAPMPVGPYSQAIKVGNFLFVSGQIPIDPRNGNIVRGPLNIQVRYVMENIKNILEAAGYTLEDVVMVYVYLKDISKFNEFNKIYEQYFAKSKPARVTVEVARIPKDVDVEISVIAYKE